MILNEALLQPQGKLPAQAGFLTYSIRSFLKLLMSMSNAIMHYAFCILH